MSIQVQYNGQKLSVSCQPMTGMHEIFTKAAEAHGISAPARFGLWHKQQEVDLSQPFRFTGLATKCTLELKRKPSVKKGGASQDVTLKIEIQNGGSVVDTFPAEMTLSGVLATLVCKDRLSDEILSANPCMNHYGKPIEGNALSTTTLHSLGLAGQQVRMQLRHSLIPDDVAPSSRSAAASSSSSTSGAGSPKKEYKPVTNFFKKIFGKKDGSESSDTGGGATAAAGAGPSDQDVNSDWMSTMKRPLQQQTVFQAGRGQRLGGVDETPVRVSPPQQQQPQQQPSREKEATLEPTVPMDVDREGLASSSSSVVVGGSSGAKGVEEDAPPEQTQQTRIGPFVADVMRTRSALHSLTDSNPPTVAVTALKIVVKYVENMERHPLEEKYRSIKTSNRAYVERVAGAAGALQLLCSLGFDQVVRNGEHVLYILAPDFDFLDEVLVMLKASLSDMTAAHGGAEPMSASASLPQATATPTFDPYKPMITRKQQQPVREESSTEQQLSVLRERRLNMQGSIDAVERQTRVVVPGHAAAGGSPDSHAYARPSEEGDERADSRFVAQNLAASLKNFGKSGDAPLTTKAVRDLERAKREKVFDKTLLKVRFPDGTQLHGYFHPQDVVRSVADWIAMCMCDDWDFEMFMTPPKDVLFRTTMTASSGSKKTNADDDRSTHTLEAMQLVPAAILNVDWIGTDKPVAEVPGCFLLPQLMDGSLAGTAPAPSFPQGQALIPSKAEAKGSDSGARGGSHGAPVSYKDGGGGDDDSKSSGAKRGGGPRWLKL